MLNLNHWAGVYSAEVNWIPVVAPFYSLVITDAGSVKLLVNNQSVSVDQCSYDPNTQSLTFGNVPAIVDAHNNPVNIQNAVITFSEQSSTKSFSGTIYINQGGGMTYQSTSFTQQQIPKNNVDLSASRFRENNTGQFLLLRPQWNVMLKYAADAQRKSLDVDGRNWASEYAFYMLRRYAADAKRDNDTYFSSNYGTFQESLTQLQNLGNQWETQIYPAIEQEVRNIISFSPKIQAGLQNLNSAINNIQAGTSAADVNGIINPILNPLIELANNDAQAAQSLNAQIITFRAAITDPNSIKKFSDSFNNIIVKFNGPPPTSTVFTTQSYSGNQLNVSYARAELKNWFDRMMAANLLLPTIMGEILGAWQAYAGDITMAHNNMINDIANVDLIIKSLGVEEAAMDWQKLGEEAAQFPFYVPGISTGTPVTSATLSAMFVRRPLLASSAAVIPHNLMTSNNIDWQKIYAEAQKNTYFESATFKKIQKGPGPYIIRDLYIDLALLKTQIQADMQSSVISQQPSAVIVYADVVKISAQAWVNFSPLVIAARRIEVEGDYQIAIDFGENPLSRLIIYAYEIIGNSVIRTFNAEGTIKDINFSLDENKINAGVEVLQDAHGNATLQALNNLDATMMNVGSDYYELLCTVYVLATTLFDSNQIIAQTMLQWIKRSSLTSSNFSDLSVESSSLLTLASNNGNQINYIPELSPKVYGDLAQAYIQSATAFEAQYQIFQNQTMLLESRKQAAQQMLGYYDSSLDYINTLIKQDSENFDATQLSLYSAKNNFTAQSYTVQRAAISFKYGVEKWKRDKDTELALNICSAVLEFAAAAVEIACSDPDGAAQAAAAVAKTAKTVKQTEELMQLIVKMTKAISSAFNFSKEIAQSSSEKDDIDQLAQQYADFCSQSNGLDSSNDATYWDIFALKADSALDAAIAADVDGAIDYKLQLDILAKLGNGIFVIQQKLLDIAQDMFRLQLQQRLSNNQKNALMTQISQVTSQEQFTTELMQKAHERYLDLKRPLFVALAMYNRAYLYWALSPSRFQPSIVKSVAEQSSDISNIQVDYVNALTNFYPHPQRLNQLTYSITDASSLQQFTTSKKLTITFSPHGSNSSIFNGYDRIRISTIRFWAVGSQPSITNGIINIQIQTTGEYQDTYKDQTFQFTAEPLMQTFQYRYKENTSETIIVVDGELADEQAFAYFQPTPFTTWQFTLKQEEDVNLSLLSEIRIDFSGSVIYHPNVSISALPTTMFHATQPNTLVSASSSNRIQPRENNISTATKSHRADVERYKGIEGLHHYLNEKQEIIYAEVHQASVCIQRFFKQCVQKEKVSAKYGISQTR